MRFELCALFAGAGLLACTVAFAAEYPFKIKKDDTGHNYIVEKQGTRDNPVLITRRVAPDNSTHFMKRWFDCKDWKVRYLGEGPTLEAMDKGAPDPAASPIADGSIADQFARHACPAPHPPSRP